MQMHNLARAKRVIRVKPEKTPMYDFDALRHGDVLEVENPASAREMFRRWKKRHHRHELLVASPNSPWLLFFIDDEVV